MIRDILALIHVVLCRGCYAAGLPCRQAVLIHLPGNAATTTATLWMMIGESDESWRTGSVRTGVTKKRFEFARQTGFTGVEGAVSSGDVIQDSGNWIVQDVNLDEIGAVTSVNCTIKKARMLGVA